MPDDLDNLLELKAYRSEHPARTGDTDTPRTQQDGSTTVTSLPVFNPSRFLSGGVLNITTNAVVDLDIEMPPKVLADLTEIAEQERVDLGVVLRHALALEIWYGTTTRNGEPIIVEDNNGNKIYKFRLPYPSFYTPSLQQ